MTRKPWQEAESFAARMAARAASDTAQLEMFFLAERALTESTKWPSYVGPDGKRHFENVSGPLADGLASLIGVIRAESTGRKAHENRLQTAQQFFAAGWSMMVEGHDIEAFRQAAVADMPELPDEAGD